MATAAPPMVQTSSETDREALVAFFNATGGPNWHNNNNWLSDVPIGEWSGVTTDDNGRVTRLLLFSRNQLSGELPPELGNLANLQQLSIHANQLSGEIPPELGNLASLTHLSLGGNELSGEIPPELGNLADLAFLYLNGNPVERVRAKQFVGPVEYEIFGTGWSPVLPVRPPAHPVCRRDKFSAERTVGEVTCPLCATPCPPPTGCQAHTAPSPRARLRFAKPVF